MPSVLRRSGQDYEKNGQTITPRAAIHFCFGCGWEGAPFGDTVDGKQEYWCGWTNNQPACVGKKEAR
jgi:hypothetical protein